MGTSCGRQEVVDARYLEVRCPFATIKSEAVVVPLPLQLNPPPPLRKNTAALNTFVEEYNAKLRVGHKLLDDITEALNSITFTYYSDSVLVKDFAYKAPIRGSSILEEMGPKIDSFRYLQLLSERIADFLVIDCTDEVILKAQHQEGPTKLMFTQSVGSSINSSFSELTFQLDFDFWGCRELIKIIIKLLSVALDLSIVKHRYGNAINQDIALYKQKLSSQRGSTGQESKISNFNEFSSQKPEVQNKVISSLQHFFNSSDPILNTIAVKFKALQGEDDQEWGLPKTDKISALFEGIAWLTKHTAEKYRGKYNQEIAQIIKAGVGAESILIRAESLTQRWPKFEEVNEKEKSKAAILEKWWAFLQNSFEAEALELLLVSRMIPATKEIEIYSKGTILKDAERLPVGSPFLDLSEEMLKTGPTYQEAEVLDPYRFEERLTVKFKHIPQRPMTIKKLKKQDTQQIRPSCLLNEQESKKPEDNCEMLKFPQEMGRRQFKSLLAFLAQRLDQTYFS